MPSPEQKEHSKSIKQALMMQEQAQEHLPEGVKRRLPPGVAQAFHANDVKAGYWFDSDGNPKVKSER